MLVLSRPGSIELLPAARGPLEAGRAEGVRCRGGITVALLEWNGTDRRLHCRLQSKTAQKLAVFLPALVRRLDVRTGTVTLSDRRSERGRLEVELKAGEAVAFSVRW